MANNSNSETVKNTGRLLTFRTPRDLTLGGINKRPQPNKKVFTPNLAITRNKNSTANDVKNLNERDGKGRNRNNGANEKKGRNFQDKRKSNLIQTEGLFSEGTGLVPIRKSEGGFGGGSGSRESNIDSLRKPTFVKQELKIDHKLEQKKLSDILGDDDEMEVDEDSSKSSDSDNFMPIKLKDPNKCNLISKIDSKVTLNNVKIKTEPGSSMDTDNDNGSTTSSLDTTISLNGKIKPDPDEVKSNAFAQNGIYESVGEFLDSQNTQLFLMQLPDTLPGRAPDSNEIKSEDPQTIANTRNYCTMQNLQEGNVGKIVRYKSGKTKLILGESMYDIDLGLNSGFLQEIVSITANREERSGNMINLGQVKTKLNIIPDWEYLFHKSTS